MIALIIGATGATGKDLVNIMLNSDVWEEVRVFVRRENAFPPHPKLKIHVVNFDTPHTWKYLLAGADVAFSCMGTTRKDAGSKECQRSVDKDYQHAFAANCYEEGVQQFVLISSRGASVSSPFFYPRIKGELDKAVEKIPFRRTFILRPNSLIREKTTRKAESIAVTLLQSANNLGLLMSYRPISTKELAQKMLQLVTSDLPDDVHILEGNECEIKNITK